MFQPIVDVSVIEEQCYEIYDGLFGVRGETESVAQNRGFPELCSKLVRDRLEDMEFVSYVHFSEMKAIMDDVLAREGNRFFDGWKLISHCMERLSSMYGDENVRMVVGFC